MSSFDAVIWDWNGTLMDDVTISVQAINAILTRYNMKNLALNQYREIFRFPVSEYYKDIGFDFREGEFEKVGKEFIDEYEARWQASPLQLGVPDVLQKLKALAIPQFVLSAASLEMLTRLISHYAVGSYFQHFTGLSNIYASGKLQIGQELIKTCNLNPDKTLLVGDTSHDAEVAKGLGCHAILVARGHESASRLQKNGVPVVENATEILKFFA
jgi:phosphoglycolate phosphatase